MPNLRIDPLQDFSQSQSEERFTSGRLVGNPSVLQKSQYWEQVTPYDAFSQRYLLIISLHPPGAKLASSRRASASGERGSPQ